MQGKYSKVINWKWLESRHFFYWWNLTECFHNFLSLQNTGLIKPSLLACYKNDKLHFTEFVQNIHFLKNLSNHIEDVYFWNTRKRRLMSACPVQFYTKDVRCFLPQKRFDTEKRDMEVDLPSPPFFRKSTYIYIG